MTGAMFSGTAEQALEKALACEHRIRDIVNGLGAMATVAASDVPVTSAASQNIAVSPTLQPGQYRVLASAGAINQTGQALVTFGFNFSGTVVAPLNLNGMVAYNSTTGESQNSQTRGLPISADTYQWGPWPSAGTGTLSFFAMGTMEVSVAGSFSLYVFGSASTQFTVLKGAFIECMLTG